MQEKMSRNSARNDDGASVDNLEKSGRSEKLEALGI